MMIWSGCVRLLRRGLQFSTGRGLQLRVQALACLLIDQQAKAWTLNYLNFDYLNL